MHHLRLAEFRVEREKNLPCFLFLSFVQVMSVSRMKIFSFPVFRLSGIWLYAKIFLQRFSAQNL